MNVKELKKTDYNTKLNAFKEFITNENSDDMEMTMNIFYMIKRGNNNRAKSFYEHESVVFEHSMELVDLRNDLKEQIDMLENKLIAVYLACIRYCGNFMASDKKVDMPKLYLNLLSMFDLVSMSTFMDRRIDLNDENIYNEAFAIISTMANKMSLFSNFLEIGEQMNAITNE